MSYNTIKELIDRQDTTFPNSAYTMVIQEEKNKKLAEAITREQEQERKQYLDVHNKQLDQLEANYKKLNDLYELKSKELDENKKELEHSKKYNKTMLIIALVSAAVSIVSLLISI